MLQIELMNVRPAMMWMRTLKEEGGGARKRGGSGIMEGKFEKMRFFLKGHAVKVVNYRARKQVKKKNKHTRKSIRMYACVLR